MSLEQPKHRTPADARAFGDRVGARRGVAFARQLQHRLDDFAPRRIGASRRPSARTSSLIAFAVAFFATPIPSACPPE